MNELSASRMICTATLWVWEVPQKHRSPSVVSFDGWLAARRRRPREHLCTESSLWAHADVHAGVGPSMDAAQGPKIGKGALPRLEGPHGSHLGCRAQPEITHQWGHQALSCRPPRWGWMYKSGHERQERTEINMHAQSHTQSHTQSYTTTHNHTQPHNHTHSHRLFQTVNQYSSKIPLFSYLFIWTGAYLTQKSFFFGFFLL